MKKPASCGLCCYRALMASSRADLLESNFVSDGDGDGSVEPFAANSEVLMLVVDSLLVLETVGSFAIGK